MRRSTRSASPANAASVGKKIARKKIANEIAASSSTPAPPFIHRIPTATAPDSATDGSLESTEPPPRTHSPVLEARGDIYPVGFTFTPKAMATPARFRGRSEPRRPASSTKRSMGKASRVPQARASLVPPGVTLNDKIIGVHSKVGSLQVSLAQLRATRARNR